MKRLRGKLCVTLCYSSSLDLRYLNCHNHTAPILTKYERASSVDSVAQTARLLANQTHWSQRRPGLLCLRCQWTAEGSCQCHKRLCSGHQRRLRPWGNSCWRTGDAGCDFGIELQLYASASLHLNPPKHGPSRVVLYYFCLSYTYTLAYVYLNCKTHMLRAERKCLYIYWYLYNQHLAKKKITANLRCFIHFCL